MISRRFVVAGLLSAVALALACEDELDVPTTGSIVLNVQFAGEQSRLSVQEAIAQLRAAKGFPTQAGEPETPGDSAGRVDLQPSFAVASFTSVRATADGPSGSRTTNLTLVDDFWEGSIESLQPGDYTVTVQAFEGTNELAESGSRSGVTVVAGGSTPASLTLVSFKPALNAIASPGTRLIFPVTWSAVTGASGYRVEASLDSNFAGARSTSVGDSTNAVIAVNNVGAWNVRVRATATGITGAPGASRSTTVSAEASGTSGDDPAGAPNLGFGAAADGLLTQLNIAPSTDEDWFGLDACQQDSLIVDAIAAGLTQPSPLNTFLRLFAADGTTILDQNDDFGGITDALLELQLPTDGPFFVQVTGVGGTTGAYELDIFHVPGANNTGTSCAIPPLDSLVVNPGAIAFNALTAQQQLSADAYAGNAIVTGVTFIWATDDSSVATVDVNGLVTATGNGTANITATSVTPAASPPPVEDRPARNESERLIRRRGKGDRPSEPGTSSIAATTMQPPVVGTVAITVAQAAASLSISPPQDTITFIGGTAQFTASVLDPLGSAIVGPTINWSSDNTGVATVDATGNATAVSAGTANIAAAFDTVSSAVGLAVAPAASALNKTGGDGQVGFSGSALAQPLAVRIVDAGGTGVAGVAVNWAVATGGGTLSAATTTTDAAGDASVTWTLGAAAGGQSVNVTGAGFNRTFSATAIAGVQWTNAAGGLWSVGSNWSTGVVPGATDTVLIGLSGNYQVTVDVVATVARLTLGSGTGATQQTLALGVPSLTVTERMDVVLDGLFTPSSNTVFADTLFVTGGVFFDGGTVDAIEVNNLGSFSTSVNGGSVDVTGTFTNSGSLLVADTATFGIFTGVFEHQASGTVTFGLNSILDLTNTASNFSGGLTIPNTATVFFDGNTVSVAGGLSVLAGGTLDITNASVVVDTLDNAGDVFLNASQLFGPIGNSGFLQAATGVNRIDGVISTTVTSSIDVDGETTRLDVTQPFTNNGSLSLGGVFAGLGNVTLDLTSAGSIVNSPTGSIDLSGVAGFISAPIDNQGSLTVTAPGTSTIAGGALTNSGFVQVGGNLTITSMDNTVSGTVSIDPGNLLFVQGTAGFSNAGSLEGGGTLDVTTASMTNSGTIDVGPSTGFGILTINGDVTLGPTSVLDIEINGMTPGVDQDQLVVTGTITLDGELNVIPGTAFGFTYGNTHQIITFTTRNSGFSDLTSLDFGGTGAFKLYESFSGTDLALNLSVPQVVVTPLSPSLSSLGATVQLSAEARQFNDVPIPAIPFTWNAITPTVISVDGTGFVTALSPGASQVDAVAVGGAMGTVTVTVAAAGVASVTLTPDGPTIDGVGSTSQLSAVVRDSLNNVVPVPVMWGTFNANVATAGGTGLVTAVGPGQTTVTAAVGNVLGTATVTVVVDGLALANVWADDGSPVAGAQNLQGVWGSATNDVWGVGTGGAVVHWNGTSWSIVDIGAGTLSLGAIWGLSPTDIWVGAGTGEVFQYDGNQWAQLAAQTGGGVSGIWARAPDDLWIALPQGNVSHWDGSSWTQMNTGQVQDLFTIWGSSAVDVWAAGRSGTLVHYTGSWAPVGSGTAQNIIDIWGAAGNDVWATAARDTLLHYNGTTWTPTQVLSGTFFTQIAGLGRQDIYATGSQGSNEEIWHYDGVGWTRIASFSFASSGAFQGMIGTPNTVVVGVTSNGNIFRGYLGASLTINPDPGPIPLVASGDTRQATVSILEAGGNPISGVTPTWTSDNAAIADVDQTGLVTATGEGMTNVNATVPGGATDLVPVDANFGFTGSVVVTGTGAFADPVRMIPGNVPWDGDELVLVSGEEPWIDFQSLDSIIFRIPDVPVGTQQIEVFNQGPNDFMQTANLSVVTGFDRRDVSTALEIAGVSFPIVMFVSLEDDGGDPNATLPNGIDDHYWAVNPSASNLALRVTLEWQTAADLNIFWTDNVGTCCNGNLDGAGFATPEVSGEVIPTLGDWRLQINKTDRGTPRLMARVTIEQTSIGTSITAGEFHSCAISVDGGAQCWGSNNVGQLGDGTQNTSTTPVDVMGGLTFIDLSAGDKHTCGVVEGGDAYCWGLGSSGQLGNGGFTSSDAPVLVSGGLAFSQISAGSFHTCGLEVSGGGIYCWGAGFNGQLGNGGTAFSPSPTQISDARVFIGVAAGGTHSCAVDLLGTAFCWGNNFSGQLGDGTNSQSNIPIAVTSVPLRTFQDIEAGGNHTCAIMDNASAYCWGTGAVSGWGSGSSTNSPLLVSGGLSWEKLSDGGNHACGVTTTNQVRCWGQGEFGRLGSGGTTDVTTPVAVSGFAASGVSVAAGGYHSCAIDTDGNASCWGRASNGQLGDATTLTSSPQLVSTDGYTSVTSGTRHTCARNTTVGVIECWGEGSDGQIGNGSFVGTAGPVTVSGTLGASTVLLDAGDRHTCAVRTSDSTAWCWGANGDGQLGIGSFTSSSIPVVLPGKWTNISAGLRHTCGIDGSRKLWCWGGNSNGQLGDGTTTTSNVPVRVWNPAGTGPWGNGAEDVSAGAFHTCSVGDSVGAGGEFVDCWGFNGVGELGNGTSGSGASSSLPVRISAGNLFLEVALGFQYSCANGVDGSPVIYCWGGNAGGQFGDGTIQSSNTPRFVLSGFANGTLLGVSSGTFEGHSCSRSSCWGNNPFGQVGNGSQTNALTPSAFASAGPFAEVAPARSHSCGARASDGAMYCWGDNSEGFLGLGTIDIRLGPVAVVQNNPFQIRASSAGGTSTTMSEVRPPKLQR